jgi:hypothetical protein
MNLYCSVSDSLVPEFEFLTKRELLFLFFFRQCFKLSIINYGCELVCLTERRNLSLFANIDYHSNENQQQFDFGLQTQHLKQNNIFAYVNSFQKSLVTLTWGKLYYGLEAKLVHLKSYRSNIQYLLPLQNEKEDKLEIHSWFAIVSITVNGVLVSVM